MATVNEEFLDALLRHQIGLLRLSGHIRNRIYKLLDATEADMVAEINRRLAAADNTLTTPAAVRRMQKLVKALRATRLKAWKQVDEVWLQEMVDLATNEPLFTDTIFKTVAPVIVQTVLPTAAFLRSIVAVQPFQGKTLKEWAANIRRSDLDRIAGQVKIGMVQGEGSRAIARRVVGSSFARGRDGATEITRRGAEAITRTVVNGVSNQARREYFQQNSEFFDEELYVATLDSRTTPICRSLDGDTFPIGQGPIPPLHFQCRSLRVAVITPEALGSRPAKPVTEKQLLREFANDNRFRPVRTRAALPFGTKGKFDAFSRDRIRELTGTVPAKVTYQQWLTRQSAMFQNDVLGVTRGRLFRKGGLDVDSFVDSKGKELTLSQLAVKEKAAFTAAGLNPADF